MQPHTSGEGGVGPSDQTTPCTPHTATFLSTKQSKTRSVTTLRPTEGTADADWPTTNPTEEVVDTFFDTNADVEEAFLVSSHVTRTSSIVTTFLVDKKLVPIKIENIPGDYRLFYLVL